MFKRILIIVLVTAIAGVLAAAPKAQAQTTWYVDDDAPDDPGPGDPTISDPLEDGSPEHPFDAIQEGIDAAADNDTVLVADGVYSGQENRDVTFGVHSIVLRSANGPTTCIIDCVQLGRGVYLSSDSPPGSVLIGLTIQNGQAHHGAGIAAFTSLTIADSVIRGNTALAYSLSMGGGIFLSGSDATIVNCVIPDNVATSESGSTLLPMGGGIYCHGNGNLRLIDCTLGGNTCDARGGAIYGWYLVEIATCNCVFAHNDAPIGPQVALEESATLEITHCTMVGGQSAISTQSGATYTWGPGNIDANPLFVDADGPDDDPNTIEDNDYRLSAGSPCIDAGDNTAVPADVLDLDGDGDTDEPIPFDLDGNPRFVDDPGMPDGGNGTPPIVDMGAYEFQGETCFGDLDGDDDVDLTDLAQLLGNYGTTSGAVYTDGDLDRDSDVDLTDLAALLGVYGATCP
jgi:hypothetical protein